MGIPKESLIKWVSRHLGSVTEEGGIHHFELAYDGGESGLLRLEQFDIDQETVPDAVEVATAINGVAEEDATTRRGPIHRYTVLAFVASEPDHVSMTRFSLLGKASLGEEIETEQGTEKGVTAQLMRHNEQIMSTMSRVVEATMGRLMADNEIERARRLALEEKREDIHRLREELLTQKEEREAKLREEERAAARTDALMSQLLQHVPLLLTAVAVALKKKGDGGKAKEETATSKEPSLLDEFKSILGEIDESKLASFTASLPPEQQTKLMALVMKTTE